MRAHGSRMSKIMEVEQPWRPRRNRRNRKWKEGPRNMRAWSTKIIKLLDDDDFNGRNSPCSVVSFSLSLDNQLEGTHGDSEWIRTAHIKTAPVDDEDRRSPLFTGRMLRRNNFVDNHGDPRQGLSYECPSNVGRNPNASRLSIRERLEPPRASMNPPAFDIPPRLESPEIDIRHELKCSCIEQHMEGPGPLAIREREPVGIAAPLEPFVFHRDQRGQEEPPSHFPPRFMRDEFDDAYDNDRLSRSQFSPPQRQLRFRRSLYYPPGYRSPTKPGRARPQRSLWPWLKTPAERAEDPADYADQYIRRARIDYNVERFERDTFLPPGQRHYEPTEHYRPPYPDHRGNNLRESRSEMSLAAHQVSGYSNYRSEAYEVDHNMRRDDGQFDWSYSRVESYGSSFSPQRFYNSGPPPYSSGSSHPPQDSIMDAPHYNRGVMESPSSHWEGPPGRGCQRSFQDR